MAQELNTVGAPTEGLGQTVTFQPDLGAAPVLQLPTTPQGVRAGIVGGQAVNQTRAVGVDIGPNPMLDAINKVAGGILNKAAEQAKLENYVRGMQEAVAGRSIQEISDSQPWYSKLFGGADVVEGARAYTQHATAAKVAGEIESELPKLEALGQDEAQRYFVNKIQANLTGDAAADAQIMGSFTKLLPTAMKAQAKMNYAYRQKKASAAFGAAMDNTANRLSNLADLRAGGFITDEDMTRDATELVRLSVPPEGMDEEVWQSSMAGRLSTWAASGKLHAVNAFTQAGLLSHLKPEQAKQVQAAIQAGEREQRQRFTAEWNNDLIDIALQAARPAEGTTTGDLLTKVDTLNAQYKRASGSSEWLIGPNERAAYATRNALYIDHAREQDLKERLTKAGKEGEKVVVTSAIREALVTGRVGDLVTAGTATQKEVNFEAQQLMATLPPEKQSDLLFLSHNRDGYVLPNIADTRTRSVEVMLQAGTGGYDKAAVDKVYGDWLSLYTRSPGLASAYYKDRNADMLRFHEARQTMGSDAAAFTSAFVLAHKGRPADRKTLETVAKTVAEENDYVAAWARSDTYDLEPFAASTIAQAIGSDVERRLTGTNGDEAEVARSVFKEKVRSGDIEVLGGYAVINPTGDRKPLASYLTGELWTEAKGGKPLPTDTVNTMFRKAVEAKLYGDGTKAGVIKDVDLIGQTRINHAVFSRLPTAGKQPMVHVYATTEDGQTVEFTVSGADVLAQREVKGAAAQPPRGNRPRDLTRPSDFYNQ